MFYVHTVSVGESESKTKPRKNDDVKWIKKGTDFLAYRTPDYKNETFNDRTRTSPLHHKQLLGQFLWWNIMHLVGYL